MERVAAAGLGRRPLRTTIAIAAGLTMGVVGAALLWADRSGTRHYSPVASIARLRLPAAARATPPAPVTVNGSRVAPDVEPRDAREALTWFLEAERDGHDVVAYALTDRATRTRVGSGVAWATTAADRLVPTAFHVDGLRAHGSDVDADVTASHRPVLNPFVGLVPARAAEVWRVHLEDGHWRVAPNPIEVQPVLPADAEASSLVQSWVDRLSACDTAGASSLQAAAYLYGPVELYQAPCRDRVRLEAGAPLSFDAVPDTATLVAAFGPGVRAWARLVPVRATSATGAGRNDHFLAAVGPLGDEWRVIAVVNDVGAVRATSDGQRGGGG